MLDYIALGILVFVGITIFYGIIAIHDIPYEIAKHRNHPQQDAIHVAGWISLFTLHAPNPGFIHRHPGLDPGSIYSSGAITKIKMDSGSSPERRGSGWCVFNPD